MNAADEREPLDCSEILYRGAQENHFAWENQEGRLVAKVNLFLRRLMRSGKFEKYISVNRAALASTTQSLKGWGSLLPPVAAVYSLHAGRVRDLGLLPFETPSSTNSAHAGIDGVPAPDPADDYAYALAIDLAERLLDLARFVCWRDEKAEDGARQYCLTH